MTGAGGLGLGRGHESPQLYQRRAQVAAPNNQFRPTARGLIEFSTPLLSIGTLPSSR